MQGLLGIGFTRKRCAAKLLKGFDFVRTLCKPLLINRTLRLGTAVLGVDQHPALLHAPIG